MCNNAKQSAYDHIPHTNVDKQMNEHGCGVYTIAFATSLCYGQVVMSIHYDRQKMRQHPVECLQAKKMFPFPSTYQEKKSQVYE